MPSKSRKNKEQKKSINDNLNSSIVHKPFATGTINIFNPYKSKKSENSSQPKLFLNAESEQLEDINSIQSASELESDEVEYRERNWLDSILSPWGISAIAILLGVNLISAGVIWRNVQTTKKNDNTNEKKSTIGNADLAAQEFMSLNLSTLSKIDANENISIENQPEIVPISPALAPLNNVANLSSFNTQYHYVLTEYTGDRSLALAKQKVAQISLVNFPQGVFIYLGAFTEKEQAEQFISHLKQENFPARIYPFD